LFVNLYFYLFPYHIKSYIEYTQKEKKHKTMNHNKNKRLKNTQSDKLWCT